MHSGPVSPPPPQTTANFRNFKKSTAPCKVHNMGLRYIKVQYSWMFLFMSRVSLTCGVLHWPYCYMQTGVHCRVIWTPFKTQGFIDLFAITCTDKKVKFSSYIRKFRMEQLQSHIWLTVSHIRGNICAFRHILGSPSSFMTLQLLHFEFPYIWGKLTCIVRLRVSLCNTQVSTAH
jgi:hypothetical protein